jgi:hypothetical protein
MQTDSTFLDALTQRGVLVSVSVRYWRAQKKLNPEDLGLTRDRVNERLISLGHKRLVPRESLERLALLDVRLFSIAIPDVPQAQLIELGTRQELMRVRREAAEQARHEIEESCNAFVGDCVAELRRQTAQLCSEMLASIDARGSVHQKTLNRLQRFIERFRSLNFAGDQEMERELDRARAELLSRSAEEYRDGGAETTLVAGLERLRTKARELASQDTTHLVQSFGQMGQRRFALAS